MMPVPVGRRSSWRMGGGLRMSKRRKRSRSEKRAWGQSAWDGDEGYELAGDFVDDYVARVFAERFAGYDGGGGDADGGDEEGGEGGGEGQVGAVRMEGVGGGVPEEDGRGGAVGARARAEEARTEEGSDEPGQGGLVGEGAEVDAGLVRHSG